DLADPRLALPSPVATGYGTLALEGPFSPTEGRRITFFAPDRPGEATVPVFADRVSGKVVRLWVGKLTKDRPACFHALPAGKEHKGTIPLYEYTDTDGRRLYLPGEAKAPPGFRRASSPLCRVWPNPWAAR